MTYSIRDLIDYQKTIIEDISRILGSMAEGDFRVKSGVKEYYRGQYYRVLTSMRGLRDKLSSILLQISQSAQLVADGSEQISSRAQALALGASEQASSVEELATAVNNISKHVKATEENAVDARAQTNQAGTRVTMSNRQMQEMIEAMKGISEKVQSDRCDHKDHRGYCVSDEYLGFECFCRSCKSRGSRSGIWCGRKRDTQSG